MKIKTAVILIAGYGTRMLPITKSVSKEMLPLIDLPGIYYQVKDAYLSGIREIIFVVSKRNINLIKSFFTINHNLRNEIKNKKDLLNSLNEVDNLIKEIKFTYVLQKEKGTYGALFSARKYLNNKTFAVIYGDDLTISSTPLLKQMIELYNQTSNYIVAARTLANSELPNFGLIEYEKDNILKNICYKNDKNHSNDLIIGRFILDFNIFKVRKQVMYKNGELQLPKSLLLTNKQINVFHFNDLYFNLGNKVDYFKTCLYFAFKRQEFKTEILNYLEKLKEDIAI